MVQYFLGVDIGGSKSHALITNEVGEALGIGEAGGGNHEMYGYEGLTAALQACTAQALAIAGISTSQIAGAGFGVAGYDWLSEKPATLESIASLGLNAPLEAVNDTTLGLIAGTSQGWGAAIVSGTGCNCRARDRQGNEGRVTGNGGWFGEHGGAGDLVNKAMNAVAYDCFKRGEPTRLTEAFIKLCNARDALDLIEGLVMERYHISSRAAMLVFEVARQGDKAALEAVQWAGRELGGMAVGVIRQVNLEPVEFETVLIGSMFKNGAILIDPMFEVIHQVAPGAKPVMLAAPPVVGGVLLGMEQAGVDGYANRQQLIASAGNLFGGKNASPKPTGELDDM